MFNFLEGILQKISRNFLIAYFIPAISFVILSLFAVYPLFPEKIISADWSLIISSPLIVASFAVAVILAFVLNNLSFFIYKAFEGYTFILGMDTWLRRHFINRQKERFIKLENEITTVNRRLKRIDDKINKEVNSPTFGIWYNRRLTRYFLKRENLRNQQFSLISFRNQSFPSSIELLLPTRFGNILRAAETYPGRSYSIDAVTLWGRLTQVLPEDVINNIDQSNTQCLFALNSSVLSLFFAALCISIASFQGFEFIASKITLQENIDIYFSVRQLSIYFIAAIIALLIAWYFYEASLLSVSQYGDTIRSSYDLYRFNLLEALHLKPPQAINDERQLWRRLSYFLAGNNQWEQLNTQEMLESFSADPDVGFAYIHPTIKKNIEN